MFAFINTKRTAVYALAVLLSALLAMLMAQHVTAAPAQKSGGGGGKPKKPPTPPPSGAGNMPRGTSGYTSSVNDRRAMDRMHKASQGKPRPALGPRSNAPFK